MSQISIRPATSSRRRATITHSLISFLSFMLLSVRCTSEALVPRSSNTFLPRVQRVRGGSEQGHVIRDPMTCVLKVPRSSSSTSGLSDNSNSDNGTNIKKEVNNNNKNKNNNGRSKQEFVDSQIPAQFIAETNLPTDVGQYRLRAYRTTQGPNEFTGNEPCVIYCSNKPPFGSDGKFLEDVPVRIHDQCLTSEVFRSQRYVCGTQNKKRPFFLFLKSRVCIYIFVFMYV